MAGGVRRPGHPARARLPARRRRAARRRSADRTRLDAAQHPAQPDRHRAHPRRAARPSPTSRSSTTSSWSPTRSTSTWSSTSRAARADGDAAGDARAHADAVERRQDAARSPAGRSAGRPGRRELVAAVLARQAVADLHRPARRCSPPSRTRSTTSPTSTRAGRATCRRGATCSCAGLADARARRRACPRAPTSRPPTSRRLGWADGREFCLRPARARRRGRDPDPGVLRRPRGRAPPGALGVLQGGRRHRGGRAPPGRPPTCTVADPAGPHHCRGASPRQASSSPNGLSQNSTLQCRHPRSSSTRGSEVTRSNQPRPGSSRATSPSTARRAGCSSSSGTHQRAVRSPPGATYRGLLVRPVDVPVDAERHARPVPVRRPVLRSQVGHQPLGLVLVIHRPRDHRLGRAHLAVALHHPAGVDHVELARLRHPPGVGVLVDAAGHRLRPAPDAGELLHQPLGDGVRHPVTGRVRGRDPGQVDEQVDGDGHGGDERDPDQDGAEDSSGGRHGVTVGTLAPPAPEYPGSTAGLRPAWNRMSPLGSRSWR